MAIPFDQYRAPITIFTRGHSQRFQQVAAHVNAYLYSFFPSAIKIWNSLPESVMQARNADDFKRMISTYYSDISYSLTHKSLAIKVTYLIYLL